MLQFWVRSLLPWLNSPHIRFAGSPIHLVLLTAKCAALPRAVAPLSNRGNLSLAAPERGRRRGRGEGGRRGAGGSAELVDGVDHVRVRLGRRRGELSIGSPPSVQFRLVGAPKGTRKTERRTERRPRRKTLKEIGQRRGRKAAPRSFVLLASAREEEQRHGSTKFF